MSRRTGTVIPWSVAQRRRRTLTALQTMTAYFQGSHLPRSERKRLEAAWLQAVRELKAP